MCVVLKGQKALQDMMHKEPGGKPARLCLTAISMCLLCVYDHAAGLEKSFTAVSNGHRRGVWQVKDLAALVAEFHHMENNKKKIKNKNTMACERETWLNQIISKSNLNKGQRDYILITA